MHVKVPLSYDTHMHIEATVENILIISGWMRNIWSVFSDICVWTLLNYMSLWVYLKKNISLPVLQSPLQGCWWTIYRPALFAMTPGTSENQTTPSALCIQGIQLPGLLLKNNSSCIALYKQQNGIKKHKQKPKRKHVHCTRQRDTTLQNAMHLFPYHS